MLALRIELLTGRYVATAYDDRNTAEWPPHPARVFSAMVAEHHGAETPEPGERAALEWLEGLGAPQLTCSDASQRDVVTIFVPVNDARVMPNKDDEELEILTLRAGTSEGAKAKKIAKLETRVSDAVASAGKKELGKDNQTVLPANRVRQPRTFPSVTPRDPVVWMTWPDANPSAEHRAALERLGSRIARIGHSSSLVAVTVHESGPPPTWVPCSEGELTKRLRVVGAGQLARLERGHAHHQAVTPRILPALHQPYRQPAAKHVEVLPQSLFGREWLVFRAVDGQAFAQPSGPQLARTFRRKLIQLADGRLDELLSGHDPSGSPSHAAAHMAIVPLPFVGHRHAAGELLGLALVLPRATPPEVRGRLYRLVAAWEDEQRRLVPREADLECPRLPVHAGRAGAWQLERVVCESERITLRDARWCQPSQRWATVSPIALDQHPGDVWSRDGAIAGAALSAAETSIAQACVRMGLPEPDLVEVLPASPIAGSFKARAYGRFPAQESRARRMLVHAMIRFPTRVEGPMLVGAGRYVGLGLCMPVSDEGFVG